MKIAIGSGIGILLVLAAGVTLLATFDWNRAKPWLNQRVSEAIGRPFAIHGALAMSWRRPAIPEPGWRGWLPWPRIQASDVRIGNPDWVKGTSNMAEIGHLSFSLAAWPLLRRHIVVPTLELADPKLFLQRENERKNNWTFATGQSPSSWRLDLNRLVLRNGTIHLADRVRKADLRAQIDSLADSQDSAYGIRWTVAGMLNDEPVKGSGKAGSVLSLQRQIAPYPLEADLQFGKTAVHMKGTLTRPRDLAALDLYVSLAGNSLAHLYDLTGFLLPETPSYAIEGRLKGVLNRLGGDWKYEDFNGKVGASDLAGTLEYVSRPIRPLLKGAVSSRLLRFSDLAPLIGADSNARKIQRGAEPVQPENKALPVERFKTERWTSIDTDVTFSGQRIVRKEELPIEKMKTRIRLRDGVLALKPLEFGMAGGNLNADVKLDGRGQTVKAQITVAARHLKLKQLFPAFQPMQASIGEINGEAALSASGNSVAALLGSSDGEIKLLINQGTISKLLLEEMGLNLGNIVLARLFGDRQVQLNCLASDFQVVDGVMDARTFVMDTEDATIYLSGLIHLGNERLDLTLRPDSKGLRILSLRSPLYVRGSFKKPEVAVDKSVLAMKAGSAIALGVLAPAAAALIPLMNVGPGEDSACASLLAQAQQRPVAPTR